MRRIKVGSTDRTVQVFIPDPASTDGSGKTGLVAANLTVSYSRVETDNDVTVTDATGSLNDLAALTDAHNDWGLKEVSGTLQPGVYRLDIADAVFAAGAWEAVVYVMITTSAAAASPIGFELVGYDPLDAMRLGLTALPNANAEAAGGLYTRGTGAGQINQAANGQIDANAVAISGDSAAADNLETAFDGGSYNVGGGAIVAASVTGAVGSVTGNVGGNVTGSVGSLAAQAKADVNAEVDTGIADARLDELLAADSDIDGAAPPTVGSVFHELMTKTTGSFTYDQTTDSLEAIRDRGDAAWTTATPPSASDIADAVWDEALAGHAGAGSAGEALSAAGSAGDPWSTALPGAYGAGTAGKIVGDDLNATVSSRATQSSVDTIDGIVDTIVATTDKLDDTLEDDGGTFRFTTNALEQAPTGGSAPSAATIADAVWDEARADHTSAGSFGQGVASVQGNVTGSAASVTGNVGGNVVGSVGSVATGGIVAGSIADGALTAAKFASGAFDAVWTVASRTLTSFGTLVADVATAVWGATTRVLTAGTNIVLAKGVGVTGFNDLSAAQVNAEADAAIETYHLDHLLATTYDPASKPGAADALLNELVEDDGGVARYTTNALEQAPSGSGPSAATIADAVWDEALAGHLSAGSTGEKLNDAAAAGNPWASIIEGAYTAEDLLRIIAAQAAGKTNIDDHGGGAATVTFRNVTDTGDIIEAEMQNSERQSIALTP